MQLRKHAFTHTGVMPYACTHEGCNESFDRPSRLERHMIKHSGLARYFCEEGECKDKKTAFATWTLLNDHIKEAHRPDQYQCNICLRPFRQRKNWRSHLATHDPDRATLPCTHPGCEDRFVSVRSPLQIKKCLLC